MKPIPVPLRVKMGKDPFYARCCVTGTFVGRIEWHHNLIYAGSQVNQEWAILPLAEAIHERARDANMKKVLDWIMLNRADETDLRMYSKAVDLVAKREKLNTLFGGKWEKNEYQKNLSKIRIFGRRELGDDIL